MEVDLVTHDARKFFGLLLKPNGYVLEQVLSPLVVRTTPTHEELQAIAADCVTRRHERHYRGFAAGQWKLFEREEPPRIKPLLYVYRVLLTGIHLMRTGLIEANLSTLNDHARLPYLDELIARKVAGPEQDHLPSNGSAISYGGVRAPGRRTARGRGCLPPAGAVARQARPARPVATAAVARTPPRSLQHWRRRRTRPARSSCR